MARNTLMIVSNNGEGVPHQFRIFDDAGALQAGPIAATGGAAGTNLHFVTVPAATPTGWYAFAAYRTSNDASRGGGEFYWDNATQCIIDTEEVELDSAAVETAVGNALATYGAATAADVTAAIAPVLADTAQILTDVAAVNTAVGNVNTAIGNLNDVTAAELEAALLNDGDGQALLAGIAAAVEQAFNNETDGSPTLSAIQGVVTNALNLYDGPTEAELTACCNAIQADIAALNNLSVADVVTALGNYGAATAANVTSAQTAVLAAVAALNDLSVAQVTASIQAQLLAYDGTTQADLDAAVVTLLASSGLTAGQSAILTFIRDVIEADEVYTNTTAQKLLKGTSTVLVDKTVTTATPCTINTSIIEV